MRRTRVLWALAAVVLAGPVFGAVAVRADATRAIDARVRNYRRGELRNAAGRWITHRMRFPSTCPLCQGSGRYPGREGRRMVLKECPKCKGRKGWVSPKDYRAVYYDMRTPELQKFPEIRPTLEKQYLAANSGKPWPTRYRRYRIQSWELVDETHGVVWFLFDDARTPTGTYWIWSAAVGTRGGWCVYDDRSDGPWPSGPDEDRAAPSSGEDAWEPVNPTRILALRQAVASVMPSFRAVNFATRSGVLRVRMEPREGAGGDPVAAITADALRVLPALARVEASWERVETEWRTPWRNADGDVRLMPTWIASLAMSAAAPGVWETLSVEERMAKIAWQAGLNTGWHPVVSGETAPASSSTQPEPSSPAESPSPSESPPSPSPEAPPAPVEASRPPAPPAPPRESEVPEARPVMPSTLSADVKAKAEKGLARIRELFDLAKQAHDDGVSARREGLHDLWQEKLREARAHLSEIEAAWQTDVVSAMPGRDEASRDEVANEHFGSIWNEIYSLKAMVRKMSTL